MSDKPVSLLVTALAVAPICAICILGPAVVAGFFAGWFSWLVDLGIVQIAVMGIGVAIIVFGVARYRHARRTSWVVTSPGEDR